MPAASSERQQLHSARRRRRRSPGGAGAARICCCCTQRYYANHAPNDMVKYACMLGSVVHSWHNKHLHGRGNSIGSSRRGRHPVSRCPAARSPQRSRSRSHTGSASSSHQPAWMPLVNKQGSGPRAQGLAPQSTGVAWGLPGGSILEIPAASRHSLGVGREPLPAGRSFRSPRHRATVHGVGLEPPSAGRSLRSPRHRATVYKVGLNLPWRVDP